MICMVIGDVGLELGWKSCGGVGGKVGSYMRAEVS
jgi:hypothetical protein